MQRFYIGYYGRPADPVGLIHWQTQDEAAALAGFAASSEFTHQFTGLSVTQQVTKIYLNLLGRGTVTVNSVGAALEDTAGATTQAQGAIAVTGGTKVVVKWTTRPTTTPSPQRIPSPSWWAWWTSARPPTLTGTC